MPSLPVYTPIESRDGSLTKGAFLKNAVAESVGDAFHTFRRPGLAAYSTSTAGAGQGITNFFSPDGDEYLIQVNGGTAYTNAPVGYDTAYTYADDTASSSSNNIFIWSQIVRYGGLLWVVGTTINDVSATRFIVLYSPDDGDTWATALDVAEGGSYPSAARWQLCVHNNALMLVHGEAGATRYRECWTSTNGTTWTQLSAATGVTDISGHQLVSHSDGKMYLFLATTTNPVWYSTNGVTWASAAATAGYNAGGVVLSYYGVCSAGAYLYVMSGSGPTSTAQKVYRSTNAASWAELGTNVLSTVIGTSNQANGVEVEAHFYQGLFWLHETMDGQTPVRKWWSSPDAQTWTLRMTTTTDANTAHDLWHGQTSGPVVSGMRSIFTASGIVVIGYPSATTYLGTVAGLWKLPIATAGSSVASPIGSVGAGFVDFAQDYARTFVAVKSASQLWYIGVPSFLPTQVTDADYPTQTVRGLVYLNGIFYVMDADGTIYGSDSEDITAWNPLNFIAAEFEPDGGVALAKYNFYVVAFGEYTTEFFYDAGNATGSALSPVQNGVLNVGCADGDTIAFVDDALLFVGRAKGPSQSTTGSRFVAQLEGTGYKRISSPDIDRILLADDFTDVEAVAFSVGGHSFYALNLGTSALTLVYDLSQQKWTVWDRRRTSFTHTATNVVTASGTATRTGTHSFADGDVGVVSAFTGTDTAINGTYNMVVPASSTLCWRLSGTSYSGTATGTGTATGWSTSDFGVVGACGYQGSQLAQDATNGKLYELDPATYQDDSVYMDFEARLAKLDLGANKNKFVAWADFVSDRASGNVLMRHSDDDSQTWTKYRSRSLSGARSRFHRGGSFKRRVYNFRITDNIPVRAQRVEYQVDEGAE